MRGERAVPEIEGVVLELVDGRHEALAVLQHVPRDQEVSQAGIDRVGNLLLGKVDLRGPFE